MKIAASRGDAVHCAVAVLLAILLAGCATPPSDPTARAVFEQNNDPLEPLNRQTFELNLFLDRILLKPASEVYVGIVPEQGRDAVKRALDNMKEPVVVINNVLQGEMIRAGTAVGRFVVNSTAGVGGLYDVAEHLGLDKQTGDFGQTLYVWGFPEGPYLVAPLLGPSNPRDLIGMGIDAYIDPFSYLATEVDIDQMQITRFLVDGVDQRARALDTLDDLQKNSIDFYAELRSLSQQKRAAELRHGKPAEPGANFYNDPGQGAPVPPKPSDNAPTPASLRRTLLSRSAPPPRAVRASAPAPRRRLAAIPRQTPIGATPVR